MKTKYYMVRYDGRQFGGKTKVVAKGATFAVQSTHANIAIAATHLYCDYKGYKKPWTRVITEEEFLTYPTVAHDNPKVRWDRD